MSTVTGKEIDAARMVSRRRLKVKVIDNVMAVLVSAKAPMSALQIAKAAKCSQSSAAREIRLYRLAQRVLGGPRIRMANILPTHSDTFRGSGTPVYELSELPDVTIERSKLTQHIERWMEDAHRQKALNEHEVFLATHCAELSAFKGNPFALHFVWMGVTA
ncbi:hypothetical protein [Robbsia andropogonis]|uniref:hypothetical protein n=1 Tax=Robbsia andropogonis TaxID=28092 RepID=UPI0004671D21|nr:hypothetical protein [Robbsia andropogonis]